MTEYTVEKKNKDGPLPKRIIYYILGVIEVLLAFRLGLKILGANPSSGFVSFIYKVTEIFLTPFNAMFKTVSAEGLETSAVLEPSTIIAMVVYALIVWGIVELFITFKGRSD